MPMRGERDIVREHLSVCRSATRWYCIETNALIVKRFPPSGVEMTLVIELYTAVTKLQGELLRRGAPFTPEMVRDRSMITMDQ